MNIASELQIGDSAARVREVYEKNRTFDLRLHELSTNRWEIAEPLWDWNQWGLSCLYIDFATGKVTMLKVRFQEDPNIVPHGAPPDRSK